MDAREKFEASVEAEAITLTDTGDVEDFMVSLRCMLTTLLDSEHGGGSTGKVFRIRALFKWYGREEVRERLEYDEERVPRIVSGFKAARADAVEVEELRFTSEYRPELSWNVPEVGE